MRHIIDAKKKKKVHLVAISDIHIGHVQHKGRHFARTIKHVKETRDTYWGFGGDGMENVTPGYPGNMLLEQNMSPTDQYKALAGHFKKIKGKCAYMLPGNHEDRTTKAAALNVTELLAGELGLYDRFFPAGGIFSIVVGKQRYKIGVYHGYSNAQVNKFLENIRRGIFHRTCDVIILGHNHHLGYQEHVALDIDDDGRECATSYFHVRSGTYLGYADYARTMGFPPGRIGSPIITFYGDKRKIEIDDHSLAAI